MFRWIVEGCRLLCLPAVMLALVVPLLAAEPAGQALTQEQRKELEKQIEKLEKDARAATDADDLDKARQLWNQVLELRMKLYSRKDYRVRNARNALTYLDKLGRMKPEDRKTEREAEKVYWQGVELHERGQHQQALTLFQKALSVKEKLFGDADLETGYCYLWVGRELTRLRNYTEGDQALRRALAIFTRLDEEHPDAIRFYVDLSQCLGGLGKDAESEALQREALKLAEKAEDPGLFGGICNTFGVNLLRQARWAEAEPLLRRALELGEKAGDPEDHVATGYDNLAASLKGQGKYSEAYPLYTRALAIRERVLGKEHFLTGLSFNNVGGFLEALGKYEEAEQQYRRAHGIMGKAIGEENPFTLTALRNTAAMLRYQGKLAEAEVIARRALVLVRQSVGEESFDTAATYLTLAFCLGGQGKFQEQEEMAERVVAITRKLFGENSERTATSYNNLAIALADQGKHAEAELWYRKALAINIKISGEYHHSTAMCCNNIGYNLEEQGKNADAEPWCRRALGIYLKVFGEDNDGTATAYNNLAASLKEQGKFADADEAYRRALAISRKLSGESGADTVLHAKNLAVNLCYQGRYAEAVPLFEAAAKGLQAARLRVSSAGLDRAAFTAKYSALPRLAAVQARLGRPADAWQSIEQDFARGLLDDLNARNRALSPQDQEREAALQGKLTEFNKRIELLLGHTNPSDDQRQEAEKLSRQRDQVQAELAQFQADLQAKYGVAEGQVYNLAHIQAALPPEAALLAYLDDKGNAKAVDPSGEHWACLVLKRGAPVWIKLAGTGPDGQWTDADDDLPEQVRKALRGRGRVRGLDMVQEDTPAGAPADDYPGDRLAQQRLGPVEGYLQRYHPRVRHLVVLPSKTMAAVPIESLTSRYSISYAPSGTMFAYLQEQATKGRQPAAATLLALGDPAFAHVVARPATPRPPPPDHGILISKVAPDSNGAQAGIQADDVLLSYAGIRLNKSPDLPAAIQKQGGDASTTFAVELWRDGRKLEVTVRPGRLGVMMANDPAPEAMAARRAGDELLRRTFRSDQFVPLPGTRREVEAISQLFADRRQVEALLGANANEQQLERLAQSKKLATFRYIHLATHAKPDLRGGLQSFLALAPTVGASSSDEFALHYGRLTAEHILRDWKMDADLVTLSACETGLGKQSGGEGYVGFAQALFLAGGRSLVLSLWPVDDTATALLMTRFYQNLLGGRPGLAQPMAKAAALAEAKRWLRGLTAEDVARLDRELPGTRGSGAAAPPTETHPYAHPNYWASFILIGDPGDVSQAEPVVQLAQAAPAQDLTPFVIVGAIMLLVFVQHLARPLLVTSLRLHRATA